MKRTLTSLVAVAFVAAVAVSASASTNVTLSVVGPTTVPAGAVITLQAIVTSDGGELDNTIFGAVNDPVGQATIAVGVPNNVSLSTVGLALPGWSAGSALCTTAFCTAFSQINSIGPTAAGVTNLVIGTLVATLNAGLANGTVVTFNWRTTPSTQRLDWYGITNAPGASVTIGVIPEPTTAALIGFGLFGLAFAGRRRA
jgi:hypothetical protein